MGLGGFASLTLPGILRLKAATAQANELNGKQPEEKTAVIMVWKPGGCSHIDTYDPMPMLRAIIEARSARLIRRCRDYSSRNCFRAGCDCR